jgi:hypothetical protein
MSQFIVSNANIVTDKEEKNNITLITQFFICSDNEEKMVDIENKQFLITKEMADNRNIELKDCLKKNVENDLISKIILLNERKYTDEELGVSSKKIKQINLGKHITFKDVFNHVTGDSLKGYIIMSNADIFFDKTLSVLFKSGIKERKRVLVPLRYEYENKNLKLCKLFGPTSGTQDTWIFHADNNISKKNRKLFDIKFNQFQCNHRVLYLFNLLGFELVNDPTTLKTYHHQKSGARCYEEGKVDEPFMYLLPKLVRKYGSEYYPMDMVCRPLKTSIDILTNNGESFCNDIERFHRLIKDETKFIISRTNLEFNKLIFNMLEAGKSSRNGDEYFTKQCESYVGQSLRELHKKGLVIEKVQDVQIYITIIIRLLQESSVILFPSPIKNCFRENLKENFDILKLIRKSNRPIFSDSVVSLVNKCNNQFWTELVKNKTILVITDKQNEIDKQKNNLDNIWESKVFENCEILTYPMPVNMNDISGNEMGVIDYAQNYANNMGSTLQSKLNYIDMVLLGDSPFNWFTVYYFQKLNKTVIDIGDELDLYFGIYDNELQERFKDFLSVYKNKHWINVIC